jgi:sulfur relay (sulfurtransferase) DsrC/TusE family protein
MSDQEACDGSDLEQRGDPNREFRTVAGRRILFDKEGFLWNIEDWSEEVAKALAGESGLNEMTETHWRVSSVPLIRGASFSLTTPPTL